MSEPVQITPLPNASAATIEAKPFKPFDPSTERQQRSPWRFIAVVLALIVATIMIYLFTARSVQLRFSAPAANVEVSSWWAVSLGGVYLLHPGKVQITAQADGYYDLNTEITVSGERNQTHELVFDPLPGRVTVIGEPSDAEIFVDGEAIGTLPINGIAIDAGEHEVVARHPRYQTYAELYSVEGREIEQTLNITLTPNWGTVQVASVPEGATIYVDGEATAITTPGKVDILAGEHEVSLHLEGHKVARQRIVIAAEQMDTLETLTLVQADATLRINSRPRNAGVTLNGEFVGQTPLELAVKSNTNYRVEAILQGYERAAQTIKLPRSGERQVDFSLARQMGKINVAVQPTDARLTVDGKASDLGLITLPTREHRIVISKPGFADYQTTITPKSGLTQALRVKLLTIAEARLAALKPEYQSAHGQTLKLFEPGVVSMGASRREPGRARQRATAQRHAHAAVLLSQQGSLQRTVSQVC